MLLIQSLRLLRLLRLRLQARHPQPQAQPQQVLVRQAPVVPALQPHLLRRQNLHLLVAVQQVPAHQPQVARHLAPARHLRRLQIRRPHLLQHRLQRQVVVAVALHPVLRRRPT